MDSNRASEEFYKAHPDWFAVDVNGKPHRADDLYITCVNGPYYNEHIPAILREIITLYHPEGFTDNSWSGLGRGTPCYCENCKKAFRNYSGKDIPTVKDWGDKTYQQWIRWNYDRRLELWDMNNRVTKEARRAKLYMVGHEQWLDKRAKQCFQGLPGYLRQGRYYDDR